jgi:hypothetical protein
MQNAIETLREEVEKHLAELDAKFLVAFATALAAGAGRPHPSNIKQAIEGLSAATAEQKELAKNLTDKLLPMTPGNRA